MSSDLVTKPYALPTTISVGSLDLAQLIASSVVKNSSLLSESVTYASDLSTFSGNLPAFPIRAQPNVNTVALGEHLKMFPCTSSTTTARILLASPTSPRIRSMCKECLNIKKWAEYSTGCDAPGHIPWENKLEYTSKKWRPEGSLFSSESFTSALFRARNYRTRLELDFFPRDDMKLQSSEMLKMMRELQSLRSYLSDSLTDEPDIDSPHKPPVPALVFSTSYMTFPLTPLRPFHNVRPEFVSSTNRQSKTALRPLTLLKENPPFTISYPTTFHGSPISDNFDDSRSDADDHIAVVEDTERPNLGIGEMINNLRYQCTNMVTPSVPLDDTSWNSRSLIPLVSGIKIENPSHTTDVVVKETAVKFSRPGHGKITPTLIKKPESRIKGRSNHSKGIYKHRTSTDLSVTPLPLKPKTSKFAANNELAMPTRVVVQKIPRSAMAKDIGNRTLKPYKMVRFALPKSEFDKELAGRHRPAIRYQPLQSFPTTDSTIILFPDHIPKGYPQPLPYYRPNSIVYNNTGGGAFLSRPWSAHSRAASTSMTPYHTNISLTREFELKPIADSSTESANGKRVRRSHTTGGHSFTRFIKSALKENKRATIAVDSTAFKTDFIHDKRRMSANGATTTAAPDDNNTNNNTPKKSRMPMHFKTLLTRFKSGE